MIIGAVICFGYFHTYLECNRKLEAERLLEILARNEKLQQAEPRWYTPFINFFHFNEPDAKQTQREFIKKSSQLNLSFCRPDHVFLLYANDLFLKQLQFLIDKCQESMAILREDLPFPLNSMACVLLVTLIGYILKLTFKYILSPRAWVGIWHAHNTLPSIGTGTSTGTIHHEDRISGENLRMLLHALSGGATSNQITISNTTATASLTQSHSTGSGVEEIQDALEIGNVDTSKDSAMSEVTAEVKRQDSPQKQTEKLDKNNSSNKSVDILKDKSDVESKEAKLEDVIDEET
ncbi:uncharacterized protein [Eurosta solidaginis]|uniref:uncharacterized protein n=1 Tax=Eurosta solidaginis TaxID=178769 RepID=UPI003530EC79